MLSFIIITSEFKIQWSSLRCGDRVVMENIQNKWVDVHLLVDKQKYVENYLTSIENKYTGVDSTTLQEIRMNISCRYHTGCDSAGNKYFIQYQNQ